MGPHSAKALEFTGEMAAEARRWILSKTRRTGDCWEWTGYVRPDDGKYHATSARFKGVTRNVARIAYAAFIRPIPDRAQVCHRCDNPKCANPNHLWLGTVGENMVDAYRKGRRSSMAGSANVRAVLTESDIPVIRSALAAGDKPRDIASRYGVSDASIYLIRNGQTWRHVD